MRQKRIKKLFMVCSIIAATLTISVQGAEMTVCAEEYEYDELNRVTKVIYEDGTTVRYVYDGNGNIIETVVGVDVPSDESAGLEEGVETDRETEAVDKPTDPVTDRPIGSVEDKPAEPAGGVQTDNVPSVNPTGTTITNPVKSEQIERLNKIAEDISLYLKNAVEPVVYMENVVHKLTEFAKSIHDYLRE